MAIKIGLVIILTISAIAMTNAQQGNQFRTLEERTKRIVDTITAVLKLDQNQQGSAQSVFLEYYKESDKLREAVQAGTPPVKSEFEKLNSNRDEKLKKFLTADQLKKYKEDLEPALFTRKSVPLATQEAKQIQP